MDILTKLERLPEPVLRKLAETELWLNVQRTLSGAALPLWMDAVHQYMMRYLLEQGYPDYAAVLYGLRLKPYNGGYAAVVYKDGIIALNPLLAMKDSDKTVTLNPDWAGVFSLFIRHELLHILLKHHARYLKKWELFAEDDEAYGDAVDFEVSNYYSEDDADIWNNNPELFYGGLTVWENFATLPPALRPEFQGKPFEQIFEIRRKENDRGVNKRGSLSLVNMPVPEEVLLRCSNSLIATVLQQEELRRQQYAQQRSQSSGIRFVQKPVPDSEYMQSSLQYDLNLFFGQSGKYNTKRSYAKPNKKYSGGDIILPSRQMRPKEENALALFVDRSGSFNEAKTKAAENVFAKIKLIKNVRLKVFYFADIVMTADEYRDNPAGIGSGTNYAAVMERIEKDKVKNAAIISDWGEVVKGEAIQCDPLVPVSLQSLFYCAVSDLADEGRAFPISTGEKRTPTHMKLTPYLETMPLLLQWLCWDKLRVSAWRVCLCGDNVVIQQMGKGIGAPARKQCEAGFQQEVLMSV